MYINNEMPTQLDAKDMYNLSRYIDIPDSEFYFIWLLNLTKRYKDYYNKIDVSMYHSELYAKLLCDVHNHFNKFVKFELKRINGKYVISSLEDVHEMFYASEWNIGDTLYIDGRLCMMVGKDETSYIVHSLDYISEPKKPNVIFRSITKEDFPNNVDNNGE